MKSGPDLLADFVTPWMDNDNLDIQLHALQPITKEEVRSAARTFSARTAVGEDWIWPRGVALLSVSVLDRYAAVLNMAESTGHWPSLVANNLLPRIFLFPPACLDLASLAANSLLPKIFLVPPTCQTCLDLPRLS